MDDGKKGCSLQPHSLRSSPSATRCAPTPTGAGRWWRGTSRPSRSGTSGCWGV